MSIDFMMFTNFSGEDQFEKQASKKIAESEFDVSSVEDSVLWPEWSDAALNKENWATPKNGMDGFFSDTQLVQLPSSLKPYKWIRAKDLKNLAEPLRVFIADADDADLITNNKHLLDSEFVRWFISALINLQYHGRDGLEISGENGRFIWNGRYQSWRGWMNVYSMNKAGKGVQHRPIINPNGKYIVRLYVLGTWRRIIVDDMVPVNSEGLPLLPRMANNSELWPMLLSKALLKLCSLTWSQYREVVDFHPIACLTGWVCLRLDISYLSPQDKWDLLRKYADHFEWAAEAVDQKSQEASGSKTISEGKKSKETRMKKSEDTVRTKKSKDTDRSKKSKDNAQKLKTLKKPEPVTLFLGLEDMKGLSVETVPGLSPCRSHFVYVDQSRDIPLDPKDVKPPLARWKLFRWLKWAINKGLIDPVEYFVPIRSLKIVSPLKVCEESIINRYSNSNAGEIYHGTKTAAMKQHSKHPDTSRESQTQTLTGDQPDVIFWADFNKMEPYVRDVHFFYKLDYFQYTTKISDRFAVKHTSDQRSEAKKGSKKGSRKSSPSRATFKDSEFIEHYSWPQKMLRTRNEPLYILTDSLEQKFFLISFSTFQVSMDPVPEKEAEGRNSVATSTEDYLIVEKHSWLCRSKRSTCLVSIRTAGTKSTVMELESGRHLLRVYCRSESNCFITISSDTIFHVGDRRTMYRLMSTESETIDHMVKRISNSVSSAYQAFGTEKYLEALTVYYKSYLPPVRDTQGWSKVFCNIVHEYFMEEEVRLLGKLMPEDQVPGVVRSLRIFFMNPAIGVERFNAVSMMLRNWWKPSTEISLAEQPYRSSGRSDQKDSVKDQAASVIQSFFKMILIRKYRQIHDPKHKQHHEVLNNLLKVVELFDYNKRESLINQLLRNMLEHHDSLYDQYPCSRDFEYTLQVQELTGTLNNVKPNQWLPIVRFQVNPRVTETVLAAIDLFINLPKHSLRVFNNETGREVLRVVNNVAPVRYHHSELGYTIFGYGWSEDQTFKELSWTMNIVSKKGKPVFHCMDEKSPISSTTILPSLVIDELSNNYMPNTKNYISKWIVRVVKRCIVSFRLKTSYDQVKIKFTVSDENGNVYMQTKCTSVIIAPVLCLGTDREFGQLCLGIPSEDACNLENATNGNGGKSMGENINDNMEAHMEAKIDVEESESREEAGDHRVYFVEAWVLDDSWPLTKSEWAVVMDAKVKVTTPFVRSRLFSVLSGGKMSKTELLRARRGSKQSVDSSNQGIEAPYWVLQVVTDAGSGLEVSQDRTKEKEIARMKESWAKENPGSLERGRELREAFLNKYELKTESSMQDFKRKSSITPSARRDSHRKVLVDCSELSSSKPEMRTLEPPQSIRRLPLLDLSIYKIKEDEEDVPWLKTERDEATLRRSRGMNILYAKEDYTYCLEEMNSLLNNQKEKYRALLRDQKESFWDRRALVEDAYEARQAYISSLKPVKATSSKRSTKGSAKRSTKSRKV